MTDYAKTYQEMSDIINNGLTRPGCLGYNSFVRTFGTKGDIYHKQILSKILAEGCMDENPRPKYIDNYEGATLSEHGNYVITKDGRKVSIGEGSAMIENGNVVLVTPAHTKFVNHIMTQYDISKGELPILTLRPIAWKSAVKEILWIYQMQSNKLSDLHDLGIKYWDQWDIGDGTIGCRYGATVKRHNLINRLLDGLTADPFGRRHIMSLWQEDDFSDTTGGTTSGLNPCCYETIWNVRRGTDGKMYLDMLLNQRSSDFAVSVSINEMQYVALLLMVAKHCGYEPGVFTHVTENVQIYDRHMEQAEELINRKPVSCNPKFVLDTEKTNFFEFTIDDFKLVDYPKEIIKEFNPQLKFDLGI